MFRKFLKSSRKLLLLSIFFVFVFPVSLGAQEKPFIFPVEDEFIRLFEENRHRGIDILAKEGTEVRAAGDGEVTFCGFTPAGGTDSTILNTVSIGHHDDLRTTYLGLDRVFVSSGEKVTKGQIIGEVGPFLYLNKNHLHFGVRKGQRQYLDPLDFACLAIINKEVNEGEEDSTLISQSKESINLNHQEVFKPKVEVSSNIDKQDRLQQPGVGQSTRVFSQQKIKEHKNYLDNKKLQPVSSSIKLKNNCLSKLTPRSNQLYLPKDIKEGNLVLFRPISQAKINIIWRDYLWVAGFALMADIIRRNMKILKSKTARISYALGFT